MEVGGSGAVCRNILGLPKECVSQAISLTSPRDACRSEAVSAGFRSAAVSDDVWKRFLPSDYADILARAVDRVEFDSMKNLYFRLSDPVLIDGGKMGFYVDRETGIKCFVLPARELGIAWGETPEYWTWIHHPESRFSEVAELTNVCWLEIRGRINSRMLSKQSKYSAYLVFKLSNSAWGFRYPPQKASVVVGTDVSNLSVCLMDLEELLHDQPEELQDDLPDAADEPQYDRWGNPLEEAQDESEMVGGPKTRQDGWLEVLLGEFYNEEGDDGEVVISLLETESLHWKGGLIVQGIEIRPAKWFRRVQPYTCNFF
ncbi:F-box protein PP2-B10-like isoform X2 [Phalaenopsis equestris]|uniref:F-box protein PP2-B10-like isoform X2 n=1 Tax=Phalaenopsis equestris TaxID=78828 RepID=UPI0009E594A4|nr:F-box protein PP2-B10-like isoform X2 [Phalaenopsis equestris]